MQDVSFFDDVLDEKFCNHLLKDAREKLSSGYEFDASNFHWKPAVVRSSAVVMVRRISEPISTLIVDQLARKAILPSRDFTVLNYAWTRMSFIPWHEDGGKSMAVTVYLNDVWERNWGGLFLYEGPDSGIRGFAPRFNACVRSMGGVSHATTPVSLDAPEPRFTLQVFPKKVGSA